MKLFFDEQILLSKEHIKIQKKNYYFNLSDLIFIKFFL